jgi:para-aminobenzoate synthetase
MGIDATDRPLYGVQFHPESILTRDGDRIMENFRDLTVGGSRRHRPTARPRPVFAGAQPPAPSTTSRRPQSLRLRYRRLAGPLDAERVFQRMHTGAAAVWLDSARTGVDTGRFSYLACSPGGPLHEMVHFDVTTRTIRVTGPAGQRQLPETNIYDYLAEKLADLHLDPADEQDLPFDFVGGFTGWLGYECAADAVPDSPHRASTDDAAMLFADRLVVLDHERDEVYLVALVLEGGEGDAERWLAETTDLVDKLRGVPAAKLADLPVPRPSVAYPARGHLRYLKDVEICQDLLRAGETYEVCLTTTFDVATPMSAFDVYRRLRRLNPAPYAAYLDFGESQVSSSSPERFLMVDTQGKVSAKPIKGTRPRSADSAEDERLAAELSEDPKERAENLMIVDLLRNDLGRVCLPGSIEVSSLMQVESFHTVHQLVSTIEGRLRPGQTAVDCVRASFPGGSMTGAPKVRTMQILQKVEGRARGVYSGAIGFLGVNGSADFNIVIRTLVHRDGRTTIGAGGALTVLSDPEREWQEIRVKAAAVLTAINATAADERLEP